ncbi:4750_t:CDS:1, partial [Dentiscutata heterogama]
MTKKNNTELELKVENKRKANNKELKKVVAEELVHKLEKILLVTLILIDTKIVVNTQRPGKGDKQKEMS